VPADGTSVNIDYYGPLQWLLQCRGWKISSGEQLLQSRQKMYTPLWVDFLTNFDPSQDPSDRFRITAQKAEAFLRKSGDTNHLAAFEGNQDNWTFGDTFAGVIRSNPGCSMQ
jgi:hypothetical protein